MPYGIFVNKQDKILRILLIRKKALHSHYSGVLEALYFATPIEGLRSEMKNFEEMRLYRTRRTMKLKTKYCFYLRSRKMIPYIIRRYMQLLIIYSGGNLLIISYLWWAKLLSIILPTYSLFLLKCQQGSQPTYYQDNLLKTLAI